MTETQYKTVPGTENGKENIQVPDECGYGVRHVQAFLLFMSLSLNYISRGHLGVTIVAMTDIGSKETIKNLYYNKTILLNTNNSLVAFNNESNYNKDVQDLLTETTFNNSKLVRGIEDDGANLDTNGTHEDEYFINGDNSESVWNVYRTYYWPKSTQELVQGAFFLGYFVMMFPTGLVVQRWGGKLALQTALFINTVIPMTVPWLTAWGGWKVLCVCRLVQGLTQAGLYPAIQTLLANWVPVNERGTLSSYVYTGSGFGTIVAFQLGGVLADSPWGWPSTFWVTGVMCFLGFLFVTIFGANKPTEHKRISENEKNYIIGHFGDEKIKGTKTPWKKMLTSKHSWACFSGHIGSAITFVFFLTQFPTYMHAILNFNIKSSGLLSSLPYIFTIFSTIAMGHLSDFFSNRKIFSIKSTRKISNAIGGLGTAVCITAVGFIQNSTLAVILFTVMLSCHSAGHTGWLVNYIDLAPRYSAALMAIGNTLCNSLITCLPLLVSSIVTDVKNQYQWRIVFLLMAGVAFTANALYMLFMSVDIQNWNDGENDEPEEIILEGDSEQK